MTTDNYIIIPWLQWCNSLCCFLSVCSSFTVGSIDSGWASLWCQMQQVMSPFKYCTCLNLRDFHMQRILNNSHNSQQQEEARHSWQEKQLASQEHFNMQDSAPQGYNYDISSWTWAGESGKWWFCCWGETITRLLWQKLPDMLSDAIYWTMMSSRPQQIASVQSHKKLWEAKWSATVRRWQGGKINGDMWPASKLKQSGQVSENGYHVMHIVIQ